MVTVKLLQGSTRDVWMVFELARRSPLRAARPLQAGGSPLVSLCFYQLRSLVTEGHSKTRQLQHHSSMRIRFDWTALVHLPRFGLVCLLAASSRRRSKQVLREFLNLQRRKGLYVVQEICGQRRQQGNL